MTTAIHWIEPDWPTPAGVRALMTSRVGGYSAAPFDGFNVASHVGDTPDAVARNRALLQQQAALPAAPQWLSQQHGGRVLQAQSSTSVVAADGLWSAQRQQVCVVQTADCLPLLLCRDDGRVVAAVHAGWRSLAAGIVAAAVTALAQPPGSLLAWLGPAIGPCCYRIGEESYGALYNRVTAAAFQRMAGYWHLDLALLARLQLRQLGLRRISGDRRCTACHPELFFSYRRDGRCGRMAALIWRA